MVSANDAGRTVVVYFPASDNEPDPAGTLRKLSHPAYAVHWLNPRTGATTSLGALTVSRHVWTIGRQPDNGDWLLVLEQAPPPAAHPGVAALRATRNLALRRAYQSATQAPDQPVALAFDCKEMTYWQAADGVRGEPEWLELDFGQPTSYNSARLTAADYRIRRCRLEYWDGSQWQLLVLGGTIYEFAAEHRFQAVTSGRVRLLISSSLPGASIREIAVCRAPDGCR